MADHAGGGGGGGAEESNDAITARIAELAARCTAVLADIDEKPTMTGFRYLGICERVPLEGGLHVALEGDVAEGGGLGAAGGGRLRLNAAGGARGGEGVKAWRIVPGNNRQGRAVAGVAGSWLEIKTPAFGVKVHDVVLNTPDVLNGLRFQLGIKPVKDFFNDKLDYTCARRLPQPRRII